MKKTLVFLSGLVLAAMLLLVFSQKSALGKEDQDDFFRRRLTGAWNVVLHFPECTPQCSCPGGVPNIPIPALHNYSADESFLEVGGFTLFRGPGIGSWEHVGNHQFTAHFKFFLFKPDGTPRGNEVVTSHIDLTSRDAFEAAATFDLFDTMGNKLSEGCPINETGARFE